ncbi:hypothetical protein GCM10017673_30780 [Streptosporangium violaceochromogenes]|nr:hypothetical protein GCM10017673_30780 [Streptosporangium violaceochromogenes]
MRRRDDELTAVESLTIALTAVGTFQTYVEHADAKVTTVAGFHIGAAAVAAAQTGTLRAAWQAHPAIAPAVAVLLALYTAGFLVAGYHLLQGIRPRLGVPAGANRFGLAGLRDGKRSRAAERERQAWHLADSLAEVARAKHTRVRRSLPWTALMLLSVLVWLVLGSAYG